MAGSQIATSVTILNSLHGFQAMSLTEYTTSAASAIAAGSVVEIAGAFFTFPSDEAINASSWTAITTATTAYIQIAASGSAGSQIVTASYSATVPTWRDDFQGWYASGGSAIRTIGSVYKTGTTSYTRKYLLDATQQDYSRNYRWQGEVVQLTSTGAGTFTVPDGVYKLKIICVGGGGAGGNGSNLGGGIMAGGGGGGGTNISAVLAKTLNVLPGTAISYTVGGAGNQSIFDTIVAQYAAPGLVGNAGAAGGAGASGGAGAAGTPGGASNAGGTGGGAGGPGSYGTAPGIAGNYGGGGGGGYGDSLGYSPGAGGQGIIIVEY